MAAPKRAAPTDHPLRIGFLADLHCGSRYGLVPPSFRPENAGPAGVFMDYMWACWTDFVARCPHLDLLLFNGDEMEGPHPTLKSAPDAIDISPLHQTDMAIETIGPLRDKADKVWFIRGTNFHTGKWCEALEALAKELRAEQWTKRRYSGEVLDGTFAGLAINASHAQSKGAIYPATLQNRTAWFATMADALAKSEPADIVVRSHTHSSGILKTHNKWVISTRAWKLVNPHAINKMEYYRALALLDLGAIVLTITPDGLAWKEFTYAPYKAATPRRLA